MHQVQVDVVQAQLGQGRLEGAAGVLLGLRVLDPQLGGDEQFLARDPAVLDGPADGALVAVRGRGVTAGLTPGPGVRRTPGLRPEELATLAGVSIGYYTRMERGKETRPSPAVIDALARYLFLRPAAREVFPGWDNQIRGCVARLRALAGTDPDAPGLTQLVGELLLKSPDFAGLWERYEVTGRKITTKTFQHPQVGRITLSFQGMALEGTPGHRMGIYTAEPGTPDHDAMLLLDLTAPHRAELPSKHEP